VLRTEADEQRETDIADGVEDHRCKKLLPVLLQIEMIRNRAWA
jgi:hypothetical protein